MIAVLSSRFRRAWPTKSPLLFLTGHWLFRGRISVLITEVLLLLARAVEQSTGYSATDDQLRTIQTTSESAFIFRVFFE